MEGVLVALIIFVLFPGIIFGFILLSRYLRYRETLTMLEHGITPPSPTTAPPPIMPPAGPPYVPQQGPPYFPSQSAVRHGDGGTGRATLIWGLVLAVIGLGLSLSLYPIGFIVNSASGGAVRFPLGLGPWMLAGFVPLFVGLALILGYVVTRPERGSTRPAVTASPGLPPTEGTAPGNSTAMPTNAGVAGGETVVAPPSEG